MKLGKEEIEEPKKKEKKNLFSVSLLGKKKVYFNVNKKINITENKKEKQKFILSNCGKGHWSWEKHKRFVEAIVKYGTNWEKVKYEVRSRTDIQIRSHSQKFYQKLKPFKNDKLGIDFSSVTIHNIKDMIAHLKSLNNNYDIVKIFLYLSKLCKAKKRIKNFLKN